MNERLMQAFELIKPVPTPVDIWIESQRLALIYKRITHEIQTMKGNTLRVHLSQYARYQKALRDVKHRFGEIVEGDPNVLIPKVLSYVEGRFKSQKER